MSIWTPRCPRLRGRYLRRHLPQRALGAPEISDEPHHGLPGQARQRRTSGCRPVL